jgi:hypothetical protein
MTGDHLARIEREAMLLVDLVDQDTLVGAVIRGVAQRDEYVRFLASTYHYVRWSGSLLHETAQGLRRSGGYPWLVGLVETKSREESPHDGWALDDLDRCGEDVEQVKASPAPVAVDAYIRWSLAMAEAGSPAFLGAAYALEFMSVRRARMAADNLRARARIPNIHNAVSFLVGHGDADSGHLAALEGVLGRIHDRHDQAAILLSASVLRALYPRFFHSAALAPALQRCA